MNDEAKRNIDNFKEKFYMLKGKDMKGILIVLVLVILGITIFCKRDDIYYYYQSVGRLQYDDNLLIVPNVTGFDEEDAIERLEEVGFTNLERSYIKDQFTRDGAVVKLSYDINSALNPDDRIVIYICKTEISYSDAIEVNKEYYSMNYINIVDMVIKDNKFYAIIKNKNKDAIREITYKIGFQDGNKNSIGEKTYKLDGVTILPDEKYLISGEIEKTEASYITFTGFNYSTLEVPTSER